MVQTVYSRTKRADRQCLMLWKWFCVPLLQSEAANKRVLELVLSATWGLDRVQLQEIVSNQSQRTAYYLSALLIQTMSNVLANFSDEQFFYHDDIHTLPTNPGWTQCLTNHINSIKKYMNIAIYRPDFCLKNCLK